MQPIAINSCITILTRCQYSHPLGAGCRGVRFPSARRVLSLGPSILLFNGYRKLFLRRRGWGYRDRSVKLVSHYCLVLILRMCEALAPVPLNIVMAWYFVTETTSPSFTTINLKN